MANKDKVRQGTRRWRLAKFGLTEASFSAIEYAQGGVCAVCHRPNVQKDDRVNGSRRLSIDHNHRTGKVRGLLCSRCNTALGLLDENIDRMLALAAYVEEHNAVV